MTITHYKFHDNYQFCLELTSKANIFSHFYVSGFCLVNQIKKLSCNSHHTSHLSLHQHLFIAIRKERIKVNI